MCTQDIRHTNGSGESAYLHPPLWFYAWGPAFSVKPAGPGCRRLVVTIVEFPPQHRNLPYHSTLHAPIPVRHLGLSLAVGRESCVCTSLEFEIILPSLYNFAMLELQRRWFLITTDDALSQKIVSLS